MKQGIQFCLGIHHDGIGQSGMILIRSQSHHIQIGGMMVAPRQKQRLHFANVRLVRSIGIAGIKDIGVFTLIGVRQLRPIRCLKACGHILPHRNLVNVILCNKFHIIDLDLYNTVSRLGIRYLCQTGQFIQI